MLQENTIVIGYPITFCIYTTVMWAMGFIGLVLKMKGLIWGNYTYSYQLVRFLDGHLIPPKAKEGLHLK